MNQWKTPDEDLKPVAPFWFWNGEMDPDEIVSQIDEMHRAGVDGFIICARQGLKIPYLSKLWFDRVRLAVSEAKKRGMDVWIYDEQPYPSLAGGGRVALDHPEFEAKELKHHAATVAAGASVRIELDWGEVLFASAYPAASGAENAEIDWSRGVDLSAHVGQLFAEEVFHETGLTAYNRKRFLACEPYLRLDWTAPSDGPANWLVYVFVQIPVRGHKYFDKFVDPLNPDAVDYFIKITHDRYAAELGDEFGSTVKGIFTDEIHPIGFEGADIPWSPLLPALYADRFGEDLAPRMPALVDDRFPGCAKIRYRFMDAATEGFIDSYDRRVAAWCRKHGIRFIGEKPILRSAQLQHFDVPGIDTGHQKAGADPKSHPARYRANPRILASAAHFYGKRRCLCESFHSIGWGMDLQDMKWTYDWLAVQGVNLFVNHACYYTTANLTKHDAPPSQFIQMPWWANQKLLSDYIARLAAWTDLSGRRPRILLLDSVSSLWTAAYGKAEERARRGERFAETQRTLYDHHFDFWIIDPQLLSEASVSGGRIAVRGEPFDCLILPPLSNVEDCAVPALRAIAAEGKNLLVWCGEPPAEEIGAATVKELREIWEAATTVPSAAVGGTADLPALLERLGLRDFSVADPETGREETALQALIYAAAGRTRGFVLNPGTVPRRCRFSVGTKTRNLELGPFESAMVDFAEERTTGPAPAAPSAARAEIDPGRPYEVSRGSANVLRLDEWRLSIDGDDRTALVRARPLVDQLEAGGFRLPVKRRDRFGTPKTLLFSTVEAAYRASFSVRGTVGALELRVEPESIGGLVSIAFNGTAVPIGSGALRRTDGIDVVAYPLGVPAEGENTVEIRVRAERSGDGLRAPLHIAGEFSVADEPGLSTLVPSIGTGAPLNRLSSGLPFYAGAIRYRGELEIPEPGTAPREVRISDPAWRSSCRLAVSGRDLGARAWHPFAWRLPDDLPGGKIRFELSEWTDRLGYFEAQRYDAERDRYVDYASSAENDTGHR